MPDYLFLMHNDAVQPVDQALWEPYLASLRRAGALRGGSEIGGGVCVRKVGSEACLTGHIRGFIRVGAASLDAAQALVQGNPVFEAGGTVEIRDLPQS
jgi:hypothetical protein